MRLKTPRIQPLEKSQWDDDIIALLERARVRDSEDHYNVFTTLARHKKLLKRWLVFGSHIMSKSSLPGRDREILILRIGWLCRAEYEWAQHVIIGKDEGLTDDDIRRIMEGPDADGWGAFDAVLLRAVDELHSDAFICDDTWKSLSEQYDTNQMMDLIFTVGQYNLVSMALNSLGVQLDAGLQGFPVENAG